MGQMVVLISDEWLSRNYNDLRREYEYYLVHELCYPLSIARNNTDYRHDWLQLQRDE